MPTTETKLAIAKTVLSTVGSIAATAMVVRTVAHDYLPYEFRDYLFFGLRNFFSRFSPQITMVIGDFDGLVSNEIYAAAQVYLGTKMSPDVHRLKVSKPDQEKSINVAMESNEECTDFFDGAKFKWVLLCRQVESKQFYNPHDMNSTLRSESRSFELSFHKKHKQKVLESYLPHILEEAKSAKHEKKAVKIFTFDDNSMYSNMGNIWTAVTLDHPANFDTLAMESELKDSIMKDLERFVKRRDYYRKVGKAWKRGYLLYGPPGTGKSSLIAAMANYLNFDIYDLELTGLQSNSDLRRLLVATANRSIMVVEDIDCTIELQDRMMASNPVVLINPHGFQQQEENKVTLSGFLNFVDGLWSSCGDERIIVFTTNNKEKLDPALLRPGRMDVHIHMSYCTPCGFRVLASNYLGLKDHQLFGEIEEMIRSTEVTPAEVAEQLLKCDEPEDSLSGLIDFLHQKKKENEEVKAKKALELESAEKEKEIEELKGEEERERTEEEVEN